MGIESRPLCCVSNRMTEVAPNAVLRSFHFLKKKLTFFNNVTFQHLFFGKKTWKAARKLPIPPQTFGNLHQSQSSVISSSLL